MTPATGTGTAAGEVPGVDRLALAEWVASLDASMMPPIRAVRVGLGQSNLTYIVSDSIGQRRVLRRPPVGPLLQSAHDVLREARILTALAPTDVPVPRIHGIAEAGTVADAPLVLMQYVDGVVLDRVGAADDLDRPARRTAGLALPETLARVHSVDIGAVGLADLSSHSSYAARQLRRWSGQWEKSKTRELAELEQLTERLRAAIPTQRELTLVHGDLHMRNIIISPVSGKIIVALDWELSTLGDPLADLGTTLAYWPEPGEPSLEGFGGWIVPGFPRRAELTERYVSETGREVTDAELGFWHALALWKIAIIAEGVLRRAIDDPSNRAESGTPDQSAIDDMVSFAHSVADDAGI
jgi:aminoglycoside phosphotransferase (APT) family kinase protein